MKHELIRIGESDFWKEILTPQTPFGKKLSKMKSDIELIRSKQQQNQKEENRHEEQ